MMDEDARREVLARFMVACDPVPTQAQVADWGLRHPELALDFGEFADAMARSPGTTWEDDGRGALLVSQFVAVVEEVEGAFSFLLARHGGRGRARSGC